MTDPARPIIQIQNVSKRFGKVTAVDNVTLDINAGEFFVLLGPSGCGKTTLLRMIAGFELPSEGQILIDGQDMAGNPPQRRPVQKGRIGRATCAEKVVETGDMSEGAV